MIPHGFIVLIMIFGCAFAMHLMTRRLTEKQILDTYVIVYFIALADMYYTIKSKLLPNRLVIKK